MRLYLLERFTEIIRKTSFFKLPQKEPDEPIRAELFIIDRLEQHAESLARAQSVSDKHSGGFPILERVKANGRVLSATYRNITQTIREERSITPAAEWLVDNFYIVEEQILEIIDDLPPG